VDIKVLGTTFNFKSYDNLDCVELLLLEGSVEMDIRSNGKSRQMLLNPGEMVQYDRETGDIAFKEFNPLSFRAFHENRAIHFFNLRFSDIMADLERIFSTKLVLLDESLADTKYFALFTNNESLDQILSGIDIDRKMKFVKKDGVIYISKK
jgi:ferric-dicitrate binding protein FerR (iron transport regulator)